MWSTRDGTRADREAKRGFVPADDAGPWGAHLPIGAVEPENHTRPSNRTSAKRVAKRNNSISFSAAYGHHKYEDTNSNTAPAIAIVKHPEMAATGTIRLVGPRIRVSLSAPHSGREFLSQFVLAH